MKKNFKFIVAAIAAVAMVGCAKDNGEKIDGPKKGTATLASFSVTFEGTRGFTDVASDEESKINDAWVFLFDEETKTLESKAELKDVSGVWKATVETTTGKHYAYVVANGVAAGMAFTDFTVADPDASPAVAGMSMNAFLTKTITVLATNLPKTDNDFLMTAYGEPTFVAPTIDTPSPAANSITMGLGRAIGKAHMYDNHGATAAANPSDVVVNTMKYKLMNNPITMYTFQQYEQKSKTGTIRNYITGDGSTRGNYYRIPDATLASYVAQSNTEGAGLYMPENWNEVSTTHNATSLLIQGKVNINAGVNVLKADGKAKDDSYTPGTTFYRVYDKQTKTWLPYFFSEVPNDVDVLLGAAGKDPQHVDGLISNKKVTKTGAATDYEFFVATYIDGQAYWALPLKRSAEKHAVARNDYFWVTIKTIAEIGGSTDSDDPDDDGPLPEDPKEIDKVKVTITADVELLKWNGILQDGHI